MTLIVALPLILTSLRIFSSQVSPQTSSNIRYDYSGVAAMISLPVNTWILSLEGDQESQQLRRTLCSVHVVVGTPKNLCPCCRGNLFFIVVVVIIVHHQARVVLQEVCICCFFNAGAFRFFLVLHANGLIR